jgi:drug/metabolite transporter (DMT)-like permease
MTALAPRQRRAMVTMLVAVLMFAMMDAMLKLLSAHYPPFQVATLRGISSLPFVLTWAIASVGWRPLLRVRWRLHLLRGVLGVGMMAASSTA